MSITPIVDALVRRHAAEVEAACEESLTNGLGYGVLCAADGTITIDSDVPYGEIHEVIGHMAAWVHRSTKVGGAPDSTHQPRGPRR